MLSNAKIQLYAITVFALLFVFGLVLASSIPVSITPLEWGAATIVSVLPLVLPLGSNGFRRLYPCVVPVLLGCFVMSLDIDDMNREPKPEYTKYEALVLSQPARKGKTLQFDALVTAAMGSHSNPFKVKVSVYQPKSDSISVMPGDGIECYSVFTGIRSHTASRSGYSRYLYAHGFRAQTLVYPDNMRKTTLDTHRLPLAVRWRQRLILLRTALIQSYTGNGISGDNLAVLSALTLGDKSYISSNVKETYSKSGASHVLALSGLHIGIIYTLLTFLLNGNRGRTWRRMFVNIIILLTVWGYVFLVGMPVSAVRSALLLTIYNVLSFSQRSYEPLNALSFAALAILVFSPMSIFDIGFQMSFIAVTAIFLMYEPIHKALCIPLLSSMSAYRWFAGMTAVSIAAQIGTAPVVAYYFGRFSCYFLLSNFVAIPVAMLLLYCSVAMLIAMPFPLLQKWVAYGMERITQFMNSSLESISTLPGSSIEQLNISVVQILAYYTAIFCIVEIYKIFRRQRIDRIKEPHYTSTEQ